MLGGGLVVDVVGGVECVICCWTHRDARRQNVRIGELEIGGDFCWLSWAELEGC